ncbi:MAG: recombination regulator RecX [Thermoanaerobaculum sp.]|nr:recombination regulator RecX [Thermoanaerobaculum sp.]
MGKKKDSGIHPLALRLLARRAYSVAELEQRLVERGYSPAEAQREVRRLQRAGLLNDRELAQLLVRRNLMEARGLRRARVQLRQRGVEPQAAQQALEQVGAEEEQKALDRALEKALRRYGREEPSLRRLRVVRYLLQRGFGLWAVVQATASLGGELDEELLAEPDDPADVP